MGTHLVGSYKTLPSSGASAGSLKAALADSARSSDSIDAVETSATRKIVFSIASPLPHFEFDLNGDDRTALHKLTVGMRLKIDGRKSPRSPVVRFFRIRAFLIAHASASWLKIAVFNRVGPVTHVARDVWQDREKMRAASREAEREQGWRVVEVAKRPELSNGAHDVEYFEKKRSFERRVRENVG